MEPVEAVEIWPYASPNSAFPSWVAYCSIFLKSFKSSSGNFWSSQYLKITATTPDWASERSKMRDNSTGPNSLTVARRRTPFCSDRVNISTGNPLASNGMPIFAWRSSIFGCPAPGCAKPLKSPLISISNTGMPLSLKFSAKTCSDFVFPVPVAPAIKPWRFMVFNGILTKALVMVSPFNMAAPTGIKSPLQVFPSVM